MSQYRSILREINRNKGGKDKHRFEIFLLRFMVHFNAPTSQKDRDAMWESSRHAISSLSDTGFESQVLRCFDFTLWIKAKIYGRPVAEIFAREAIIRKQKELSIN